MPYSPGGIRVNPNGQTAVVTFTLPGGGTPTVYSSQTGSGTVSLPATVTTPTTFYFQDPTTVTVSALVGSQESATSAGTTAAVDLSGGGVAGLTVAVVPVTGTSIASVVPLIGVAGDDTYSYWGGRVRVLVDTTPGQTDGGEVWYAWPIDTALTFDGLDNASGGINGNTEVPAGDYVMAVSPDGVTDPGLSWPENVVPLASPGPSATSVASRPSELGLSSCVKSGIAVVAGTAAFLDLTGGSVDDGPDYWGVGTAVALGVTMDAQGCKYPFDDCIYDIAATFALTCDAADVGKSVTVTYYGNNAPTTVVRVVPAGLNVEHSVSMWDPVFAGDGSGSHLGIYVDATDLTVNASIHVDLTIMSRRAPDPS